MCLVPGLSYSNLPGSEQILQHVGVGCGGSMKGGGFLLMEGAFLRPGPGGGSAGQ